MSTAAQLLKIAAKEVGVREGRDTGGNWNNRVKYNDWYAKHPSIRNNGFLTTAWCATFVSWVANQAGLLGSVIPMHAWTPSGLAWFKSRGLWTQGRGAKPGDLFYIYFPAQRRVAHVGFVERVEGGYIYTIEGNTNNSGSRQGNGVYRLKRRITNNFHFCHPKYPAAASGSAGNSSKPSKPVAPGKPKVSVSGLHNAIAADPKKPNTSTTNWSAVYPVEAALVNEGFLDVRRLDGHWGTETGPAYKKWQQKCGFKGSDADGIPPKSASGSSNTLAKLAAKYGFELVK